MIKGLKELKEKGLIRDFESNYNSPESSVIKTQYNKLPESVVIKTQISELDSQTNKPATKNKKSTRNNCRQNKTSNYLSVLNANDNNVLNSVIKEIMANGSKKGLDNEKLSELIPKDNDKSSLIKQ